MAMIEQFLPLLLPLFFTGLLSGFLAGLLGVGGGIVIVPILAYALEASGIHTAMPMHVAVASSLAIIVPTSLISARTHLALGNIDQQVIRLLGPPIFIGAASGAFIAAYLDNQALKFIFGSLAVLIGISFLLRAVILRQGLPSFLPRSAIGVVIGTISSLVGIGGGSLSVPVLASCGWELRRAVGTSALLGLFIAIPGMISFMIAGQGAGLSLSFAIGYVWAPAVIIIAAAAFLSAPYGAWMSGRINKDALRRVFAVFLIVVGVRLALSGYWGGGLSWLLG